MTLTTHCVSQPLRAFVMTEWTDCGTAERTLFLSHRITKKVALICCTLFSCAALVSARSAVSAALAEIVLDGPGAHAPSAPPHPLVTAARAPVAFPIPIYYEGSPTPLATTIVSPPALSHPWRHRRRCSCFRCVGIAERRGNPPSPVSGGWRLGQLGAMAPPRLLTAAMLAAATLVAAAPPVASFYLPGIAPVDYPTGAPAEVLAARLTSEKNKVPYDLYSLPLCPPPAGVPRTKRHLNLGQVLVGERAQATGFQLNMLVPVTCQVLCHFEVPAGKPLDRLRDRIADEYVVRLNLDNMPLVTRLPPPKAGAAAAGSAAASAAGSFMLGYPLGVEDASGSMFLYNHLRLRVLYHRPASTDVAMAAAAAASAASGKPRNPVYRIVGFEVQPMSVNHQNVDGKLATCPVNGTDIEPLRVPGRASSRQVAAETPVMSNAITYDVEWVESQQAWATRWDALLNANAVQVQIQWFSVVNSVRVRDAWGDAALVAVCHFHGGRCVVGFARCSGHLGCGLTVGLLTLFLMRCVVLSYLVH